MTAAFKNLWLFSGYLFEIFVTGRTQNPEEFHVTRIKRRRNVGCVHQIGIHIFLKLMTILQILMAPIEFIAETHIFYC